MLLLSVATAKSLMELLGYSATLILIVFSCATLPISGDGKTLGNIFGQAACVVIAIVV